MPLLIDGHNLIGAKVFPDIRLSDEDDEAKLVARLKVWRSRYSEKITVVFDRGIPGGRDLKMGGAGVDVVFAADPAQADDLIRRRIRMAGRGLIVVTNDEALLREAAAHSVKSWRGDEFVARLAASQVRPNEPGTEPHVSQSANDMENLLQVFTERYRRRQQLERKSKAARRQRGRRGRPSDNP